jgi:PAS domain S-box-containing protein
MSQALRVLILEDKPNDAELMVFELRRSGFAPVWHRVETEADFLAQLTTTPRAVAQPHGEGPTTASGRLPDIILGDYSLPQFDGMRALQLLKERELDIPFIIVTGALGDEKAAECVKQGAADFLLKDRMARLGLAVGRALREAEERRRRLAAEEALRRSHAELEVRIAERTTELAQTNELLRESEERYRTLAESAQDLIFTIGPDQRIQYANRTSAQEFGCRPEELIGKTVAELFPPDIAERHWHNLSSVFESGVARHLLNRTPFPTRQSWLNTWLVPIKDPSGTVKAVFGISRDVTDLQSAEAALRESESRFRLTVDQVPVILWTTDSELRITWSVGKGLASLGRKLGDLVGMSLFEFFSTEDGSCPPISASRQALSGESVTYELSWQDKTLDARVEPLRDADGAIVGTVSIASDITARKEAEIALRASEERYRNLFENAPIGIYRTTPEGRILMANPALLRMLRFSSFYELSLRDLEEEGFGPEYDRRRFKEQLERAGETRGLEAGWVRHDGSVLFVRENARVVRDQEGKALYYEGTVEDITDRRLAEERLFHLNAVLRAIRNINQLIARESDRERLLAGICRHLVETRGYRTAWIVLSGEKGTSLRGVSPFPASDPWLGLAVQAGMGDDDWERLLASLRQGTPPSCVYEALGRIGVVVRDASAGECAACPRAAGDAGEKGMAVRIEHGGQVYGVLVVTVAAGIALDAEGRSLFGEVAADLGLALHSLESDEERKWAQAALEASEYRYRTLVESVQDGVFTVDREGRFTFVNEPTTRQTRQRASYLIGRSLLDVVRPEDRTRVREVIQARLRGEAAGPYELAYCDAAGELTYVEIVSVPLFEEGRIVGLLGVARDLTERRRAEAALRESEQKYRTLVEQSLQGLVVAQGLPPRIVFANPALAQMLGYPLEELTALTPDQIVTLIHPDDRDMFFQRYQERLEGKPAIPRYEFRALRKDGGVRWVEIVSNRIEFHDQPAVQAAFLDITEAKEADKALRESESRYRSLVELSPDPIVVHRQGKIAYVNPAAIKLIGAQSADQMIAKAVIEFVHPDYREMVRERIRLMTQEGKAVPLDEEQFLRLDGSSITVEVAAMPIIYERQPSILVALRDITARKQAEERLARLNRLYSVLSRINEAIVRIREPGELLQEACRIAVEEGQYLFAWVGLIDPDSQTLNPVARFGRDDGYLELIQPVARSSWLAARSANHDAPGGGAATPQTANDERRRPGRWRRHTGGRRPAIRDYEASSDFTWAAEALKRGFGSSAGFPITTHNEPVGCFVLYARTARYFDSEQIELLEALAADLSFALEAIELEQSRQAADVELRENEQRFRKVFEEGLTGVAIADKEHHLIKVNPAFADMFGYSLKELHDRNFIELLAPEDRAATQDELARLYRGELDRLRGERRFRKKGKGLLWALLAASVVRDSNGRPLYALIMLEDITAHKTHDED